MSAAQLAYYQQKQAYEMDSADLFHALNHGERIVVVDGRSAEAYLREQIPGAINLPRSKSASSSRPRPTRFCMSRTPAFRMSSTRRQANSPSMRWSACWHRQAG